MDTDHSVEWSNASSHQKRIAENDVEFLRTSISRSKRMKQNSAEQATNVNHAINPMTPTGIFDYCCLDL